MGRPSGGTEGWTGGGGGRPGAGAGRPRSSRSRSWSPPRHPGGRGGGRDSMGRLYQRSRSR
ncbi:hypothetical protein CA260_14580 [Dyella jiangningensis]|uniref:Uncharacterized protein n=1 Tax=Dyella jiangningensis TaxID=1379159 RepID=A0A328NYX9_9GAMM|nr:hypothetical protein CA260_14580 [Dyella jiangningensis]